MKDCLSPPLDPGHPPSTGLDADSSPCAAHSPVLSLVSWARAAPQAAVLCRGQVLEPQARVRSQPHRVLSCLNLDKLLNLMELDLA